MNSSQVLRLRQGPDAKKEENNSVYLLLAFTSNKVLHVPIK